MKISIYFLLFFATIFTTAAQNITQPTTQNKQGEFYIYWGWNVSAYSKSDIHFSGENYDFSLQNVIAKDRQTPFNFKTYFGLQKFTIPQYNFRIGYFISPKYNISLGTDHMKYVVQTNQNVEISGIIAQTNSVYDGNYEQKNILIEP